MTLTLYKQINYDYMLQNSLILNFTPKIIMFKTNCPIQIVTRAPRGQLIHIQAKDVFMEHLHGNNMKKACAFTMQHLLILNIL